MAGSTRDVPIGLKWLTTLAKRCCPQCRVNRLTWHKGGILALTYMAYTCYHMTRKPISVVKNVLNRNCTGVTPTPDVIIDDHNKYTWCDWAPFDTDDAPALLGTLDSAFLFTYAIAMFISGLVAERVNLRFFLALGMLGSGISCYLFGLATSYNIHNFWYFIFVQALGGIFQTSGWPSVVTIVGNWFGKGKKGLLFGIWNSHTSLGNILGGLIAAYYVETDWGRSFMVPGAIMGFIGFAMFLFLAPNPSDVGLVSPSTQVYRRLDEGNLSSDEGVYTHDTDMSVNQEDHIVYRNPRRYADSIDIERSETDPILGGNRHYIARNEAIGFMGALRIPGVMEFSLSLFFAKLVSYTFLYWLPLYIAASTTYGAELSGDISTLFDVGGIAGAILAGVISDYSGMSALTCTVMLGVAIPTLFIYDYIGNLNVAVNIIMLLLAGLMVNGPYSLITTAVSAELGTHPCLGGNSKALATVTAIIDGTGSAGAAVGPLLAGVVSRWYGWHNVFYMLMTADFLALLLLSRLVYRELKLFNQRRRAVE